MRIVDYVFVEVDRSSQLIITLTGFSFSVSLLVSFVFHQIDVGQGSKL